MKIFKYILFLTLIFASKHSVYAKSNSLDSLLYELDKAIYDDKIYFNQKEKFLENLKNQLNRANNSLENQYLICEQITSEYSAFQADSFKIYSLRRMHIAVLLNNKDWIIESKINLAIVYSKTGLFHDAEKVLNEIDLSSLNKDQIGEYYLALLDTYIYWTEFLEGSQIDDLVEKRLLVQDSLLNYLDKDSYNYVIRKGEKFIETGDYDEAEELFLSLLPKIDIRTREYAILTSLLAYLHESKNDVDKQKYYLATSALSDVKSAISENTSLRMLALLLFNEGDIERANAYIKKSLDDANFFNSSLRNIQTSRLLPVIDKAYQLERTQHQKRLSLFIVLVSILSFILMIVGIFMYRQMVKLSTAQKDILDINLKLRNLNKELKELNEQKANANKSLAEANMIKEEFISSFLEISTVYIEKFKKLKRSINMKIKAGQINDVLRLTNSDSNAEEELKEMYANFDQAFLYIYPNFVEEFNKLLREEERYSNIEEGSLNNELRIFALIRLGITDSYKMATFLNFSIRTIYNYRSKVKAKSDIQADIFEEKVKMITSVS